MKYLKFLTIISVLSVFAIGYFYQVTKSELNETKLNCEFEKDSLSMNHKLELDELNGVIDSMGDSTNVEVDSLERLLNNKKSELESFKVESGFKYQKLVTKMTELNDEILELKAENEELSTHVTKKDKLIINKKKMIKGLEIKIDSLKFEINSLENSLEPEPELMIIQQSIDTLEVQPIIEIEEENKKNKKNKKKRKKS